LDANSGQTKFFCAGCLVIPIILARLSSLLAIEPFILSYLQETCPKSVLYWQQEEENDAHKCSSGSSSSE
jgi:hypothetical protein